MKTLPALLLLVLFLVPGSAFAQRVSQMPGMSSATTMDGDRIAAVVNDNVITTSDIEARLKLAFLSSGLPDTPEVRRHVLPQILRSLIDEQLQLQEAKRLGISVSEEDTDKAMQRIGEENHIPGGMRAFLTAHGASPKALAEQIHAGLAWSKVVQRELRSRVDVGDDEIEAAVARVRTNAGKQEYLVNEIFLAVDNVRDEDQVKQTAENLTQQIKHGANFSSVAREFSQSTGAASGGDIGWIQQGQLAAELNNVLDNMTPGTVAGPIRTSSGYHIIALREKRTITLGGAKDEPTVDMRQIFRPVSPHGDRKTAKREAEELRSAINGCDALDDTVYKKFPSWHVQATNGIKLSQAPGWVSNSVQNLPVGKSSAPLDTDKGLLVVVVCNRHVPEGNVDRDAIAASIGTEKLELQARRLLRDLRRNAYLDVRMGGAS